MSLAVERERALQTQTEMAGKFAREKRELEDMHTARVSVVQVVIIAAYP